jgi:hypothetical protein
MLAPEEPVDSSRVEITSQKGYGIGALENQENKGKYGR